ncbi:MAG: 5'-nucleotidase C-terminal domain-containing protein [Bacteroidia bacterium]|nr:5'-nucleotidase C-terminal domain-containing protein [Bacteroidia bacterium]
MKYFIFLAVLFTCACTEHRVLSRHETNEYVFSDSTNHGTDSLTASEIRPYREKLKAGMSIVLCESTAPFEKGRPESALGNFVSDACLLTGNQAYTSSGNTPADFAFFNTGGLRRSLPEGQVTKGDVFELMPFENQLVVLTMNGKLVKKLFNFIASNGGDPVAGVRFEIHDQRARAITIHGVPLDTNAVYKAMTSDYLANGGDRYSFLSEASKRDTVKLKVRDALIQYMYIQGKVGDKISPVLDGRIKNDQ